MAAYFGCTYAERCSRKVHVGLHVASLWIEISTKNSPIPPKRLPKTQRNAFLLCSSMYLCILLHYI